MPKTIAQLVQLAQQNDQDTIEELYRQTYNSVYQTVKTLVKDDDAALDIVQDSFVKGFDNLNQLNEPEKFPAWMRQIAANRARDYLKKKRPTLFTEMENEDGEMQEFADDCMEHLPEEVLDRAETARLVKEILDTLPEEQRAVIFMMHYEQMTVKEIAQALDCSENTVKSRLKYGREKVKVKVEDLAKKGTKLYSLAPMPYLLWLLRMAKTQNIPASTLCPAAETAINTASAAAASQAAQTVGAQVAGETAKSASKTAAKVGAKALSKKIVAGALAVTVAGGAGAVAVNSLHSAERENAAAHVVYEEFLDRYKVALETDHMLVLEDLNRFWAEIDEDIWEQNPDADPSVINSWHLDYTTGEDFEEGIPLPDTMYEPNMNASWLKVYFFADDDVKYAYHDVDGDGVDEMFVGWFFQDRLQKVNLDVYTVKGGKLHRGMVDFQFYGDHTDWELKPGREGEYVGGYDIVYINFGKDAFTPSIIIPEPDCDWQEFCDIDKRKNPIPIA